MIKIIDNFFDNKLLESIQNHVVTKCIFTPRFYSNYDKNNPEYNYSEENKTKSWWGDRFNLSDDPGLLDTFKKQTENKFKIKIKKLGEDCGVDLRNMDWFQPHIDTPSLLNVLIMLKGPIAVTNGTVFYTDGELDIHVGFRPNRAILFSSDLYHSPHASKAKGIRRYTSTLFVNEYEWV